MSKANILKQLLESDGQVTEDSIMRELGVSKQGAATLMHYAIAFEVAYRDDKGLSSLPHPDTLKLQAAEAEVQALKLAQEANKPALEFANAFKNFMKN